MDDYLERKIRDVMVKITPRPTLFFDVQVTEHCNLNCKGCASLCPIAEEEYLDILDYEKDMIQLSKLSNGEVHHINVLGGEPLLHPQINDFLELTRKYFPIGIIHLVTNGILLRKMDDAFWETCKKNDITIAVSKYPINVDYDEIEKKVKEDGIRYRVFNQVPKNAGGWLHTTLDLEGWRNESHSFMHCWQANNCSVLSHGKIYPCPVVANIRHFNKKYNLDIPVSQRDYVNIYEVESLDDIMKFYCHPIPFCRFCNTFQNRECDWGLSDCSIEEWT